MPITQLIRNDLTSFLRTGGVPGVDDTLRGPGQSRIVLTNKGCLLFYDINGVLQWNSKYNVSTFNNYNNNTKTYYLPHNIDKYDNFNDVNWLQSMVNILYRVNNWGQTLEDSNLEYRAYLYTQFPVPELDFSDELMRVFYYLPRIQVVLCTKDKTSAPFDNINRGDSVTIFNCMTNRFLNDMIDIETLSQKVLNVKNVTLTIKDDGTSLVVKLFPGEIVERNATIYLEKPSPADVIKKPELFGTAGSAAPGLYGTGGVVPEY